MLVPSILASVTNSLRFDILDASLNAIEQLPFAAHCALLWVSTMSPATCPPCLRYVQSPPAGQAASRCLPGKTPHSELNPRRQRGRSRSSRRGRQRSGYESTNLLTP